MACRLHGLAEAIQPPTSLRLQPRRAGIIRPEACRPSSNRHACTRASAQRYKQDALRVPSHSAQPKGTARGFTNTAPKRTTSKGNGEHTKTRRSRRPLATLTLIVIGAALVSAATDIGNLFSSASPKGVLNRETFVPFSVISKQQTSPTTFILTVSAPAPHQSANAALIGQAWAHGLWSVEIKQPQLQIARNYTPLPPTAAAAGAGGGDLAAAPDDAHHMHHQLRFLVRRYQGGEMSTYLSRLQPGDDVYLRGPHLGFDVGARMGDTGERVVFLAGGTGVAPALQVARHLLLQSSAARRGEEGQGRKLSMEIIWASRSRADCAGCPRLALPQGNSGRGFWGRVVGGSAPPAPAGAHDAEGFEHPVVRELRELQDAFRSRGHQLELRCVADDEAGVISGADVMRALEGSHRPSSSMAAGVTAEQASCYYHSQQLLQHSTHESDAGLDGRGEAGKRARECTCGGKGANGENLFMISGPDGFISAYVGPKVWADGAERQGPVGGLVRKLMQQNPDAWRDWLVLKQ
ncbi:hypothetical protein DHEL01_v200958 [Diaporthe helianthi]|uniref:FAD-binding FR-type domain-containing protein n=1 Tax=Diaporthe helianthi TaxID=158607 RepID=A0A2P5IDP1_DIAHE|nr:hypothetical protein DHEL01_v200958 [Diaporthe helianthi]